MHKYVIMGPNGSGKGTQASRLAKAYDLIHISVGISSAGRSRITPSFGIDYNLIFHRPKVEDACDVCSGKLIVRSDDNPEAIEIRLREYHEKTDPIIELFRKKELVVVVDGTKPANDVEKEIRAQLRLTHSTH
jgi:adenylate kinase